VSHDPTTDHEIVDRHGIRALTHFRCRYARFGGQADQGACPWYTDRSSRCRLLAC
jgi:hypothetical protein